MIMPVSPACQVYDKRAYDKNHVLGVSTLRSTIRLLELHSGKKSVLLEAAVLLIRIITPNLQYRASP